VRRDGEEVRITAQLIRVADGIHVLSETYDRKLESVFALQDDIARQISEKLSDSLGVAATVTARTPINSEAYDEYLKGRSLLRQRRDLPAAIEHLKLAVAQAPEFAEGWSSLSQAEGVLFWYQLLDKTQAADWLAPESAATQHVLGNAARERFDYAVAEQHYLRGIAIDPSNPDVREDYSELLYQVGRMRDSATATRQVIESDPYFIVGWMRRFDVVSALDDRVESERALARMRELDPNNFYSIFGALDYAMAFARHDEMRAAAADINARYPSQGAWVKVLLPWVLGDADADAKAAQVAIDSMPAMEASRYLVAIVLTGPGQRGIERAYSPSPTAVPGSKHYNQLPGTTAEVNHADRYPA
jgi:tetratricopeptide (TPR) repeat protein